MSDGKRDDKDERHALSGGDPSQVVGACCSRLVACPVLCVVEIAVVSSAVTAKIGHLGSSCGYRTTTCRGELVPVDFRARGFRRVEWNGEATIVRSALCVALVAQLDRASDFESEGRGFESLRARHKFMNKINILNGILAFQRFGILERLATAWQPLQPVLPSVVPQQFPRLNL